MRLIACVLVLVVLAGGAFAQDQSFADWRAQFRDEAIRAGITRATFETAMAGVEPIPRIIELDHAQPESKLRFSDYVRRLASAQRRAAVRDHLSADRELLARVGRRFHVQPRFIVALWGVESDFGRTMGSYLVPAALATLAYDGRRGSLFRAELIAALKILDQGDIRIDNMVGSWAGAMGQCQFMPSTFLSYAVDFDRNGRRDIWSDRANVLGSIANYISHLGWHGNEDWGREVVLPQNFDTRLAGLDSRRSIIEWNRLGVRPVGAAPFTGHEPYASLVLPDGIGGPALLVYDNFRTIKRWNNSTYFAVAVGTIADSIGRG